jgi:hypothetical protein
MTSGGTREGFDLDLHGITVRVQGALPGDAGAIEWRLGARRVACERTPDVEVRFVATLPSLPDARARGDVVLAGAEYAVVAAPKRNSARVRVPLAALGTCGDDAGAGALPLELLCEHGAAASEWIIAVLHAVALGRGMLPLHAAAFAWHDAGNVVLGESGAGKTGVLLGFLAAGARYLAADWIVVSRDGTMLLGRREPVRLRAWHVRALPELRGALSATTRARFAVLGLPAAALEKVPGMSRAATLPVAWVRRFDRRLWLDVAPEQLAHDVDAAPQAPFARLCWLGPGAGTRVILTSLEPPAAAEAFAGMLTESVAPLGRLHRAAREAGLPGVGWMEGLASRLRAQLATRLAGKVVQRVAVPPGTPLRALVAALRTGETTA